MSKKDLYLPDRETQRVHYLINNKIYNVYDIENEFGIIKNRKKTTQN